MTNTIECTLCGRKNLVTKLDLALQPPSNRFLHTEQVSREEEKFKLALGYCENCKTPQLTQRLPREAVRPRFDWIKYNEPEEHLDDTVRHLLESTHLEKDDLLIGLSYKDQSTFDRLAQFGYTKSKCLTRNEFDLFSQEPTRNLTRVEAPAKLILARHVIEHADSATHMILELKKFLKEDGYLVLEIPLNEKIFSNENYPFLWEEHISYFTKESIEVLAHHVGAQLVWSKCYEYDYEDSAVFVLSFQPTTSKTTSSPFKHSEYTSNLFDSFFNNFEFKKAYWQNSLKALKEQGQSIALFGAGHLSVKLINFYDLSSYFDCVIDDHPNKVGLFMPGSKLPIRPSKELIEKKISVCYSTLNPESETKVRKKLQGYLDIGGDFISAFNTSTAHV